MANDLSIPGYWAKECCGGWGFRVSGRVWGSGFRVEGVKLGFEVLKSAVWDQSLRLDAVGLTKQSAPNTSRIS